MEATENASGFDLNLACRIALITILNTLRETMVLTTGWPCFGPTIILNDCMPHSVGLKMAHFTLFTRSRNNSKRIYALSLSPLLFT
jgi:hypothetical protein